MSQINFYPMEVLEFIKRRKKSEIEDEILKDIIEQIPDDKKSQKLVNLYHEIRECVLEIEDRSSWLYINNLFVYLSNFRIELTRDGSKELYDIKYDLHEVSPINLNYFRPIKPGSYEQLFIIQNKELLDKLRNLYYRRIFTYDFGLYFRKRISASDYANQKAQEDFYAKGENKGYLEGVSNSLSLDVASFMKKYSREGLYELVDLLNKIADSNDLDAIYSSLFDVEGPIDQKEAMLKLASYYSPKASKLYRRYLGLDKEKRKQNRRA